MPVHPVAGGRDPLLPGGAIHKDGDIHVQGNQIHAVHLDAPRPRLAQKGGGHAVGRRGPARTGQEVDALAEGLLGRECLPHGTQEDGVVGELLDVGEIAASGGQEPDEGPHDGLVGEACVAAMGRRLVLQRHCARRGRQPFHKGKSSVG